MAEKKHRPVPGRARKRAIRAQAAKAGVPYSVAAHHIDGGEVEPSAARGRTIYPIGTDEHRRWLVERWQERRYDLRVRDAHQAGLLPRGRAEYLVRRFPTMRGATSLYDGESREAAIGMLYTTVMHEEPGLCPAADELVWVAELGEDSAMDLVCLALDRASRRLLDLDRWRLWTRVEAALAAGRVSADHRLRDVARVLRPALCSLSLRSSVDGARHTLDALLVSSGEGHAPGTRVRVRVRPYRGRPATIIGVHWSPDWTVAAYDVRPDAGGPTAVLEPRHLVLLDHKEGPLLNAFSQGGVPS